MKRLYICPKDVELLMGKSDRQSRRLVQQIKQYFGKERHQFLTLEEFCQYTGLRVERVREVIR